MPELWTPQPAVEELDEHELLKIGYNSFNIARGNGSVLTAIETYIGYVYRNQISLALIGAVQPRLEAAAVKRYLGSQHSEVEQQGTIIKKGQAATIVDAYCKRLLDASRQVFPRLDTGKLAAHLISGDVKWLPENRATMAPDRASNDDPYASTVLNYGILGHTTRVADFDEMYKLAAAQVLNWASPEAGTDVVPDIYKKRMGQIMSAHLLVNPDDRAELHSKAPDLLADPLYTLAA